MNEQHENDKTEERKNEEVGPRRPLLRSRDDRKIWGVAGGLAEHLGFNPTLVRIFFVVTLFFGGAGVLAYLVLAVALPEDDGTGQPVPESVWSRLGKVVLVCVLVAVGLFLAAGLAVVSAWVTATGHGTVIAIAVIVFGLGLVAAAFAGDIRRRIVPLLVVAGIVLGIPAAAVAAADIHIDESIGQRTYTPTGPADIPADGYRLGTGQLIVDLRSLPWAKGKTIPVSAHLGIGQMIVSVPPNVCIVGDLPARRASWSPAARSLTGWTRTSTRAHHSPTHRRSRSTPTSSSGRCSITDEAPDQIERHGVDYDHHQQEEDTQRQVCGR